MVQLNSALSCSIFIKHYTGHSKYHQASFRWLYDPRGFAACYSDISCKHLLGRWFHSWCEYWIANGGLDSVACRSDLEAILVLWQEETIEIETLHATIRRELYLLSTQVTALNFLELSDRHVLRCVRRHPISYGVGKHLKTGRGKPVTKTDTTVSEPPHKTARFGRYGGAFRAFVNEATRGDSRGCAQPGLGERFANLSPEEKIAMSGWEKTPPRPRA